MGYDYYFEFHMHLGQGPGSKQGAMMAIGTTYEDAEELCQVEDFEGRLCVAASNSSNSVTISGDADAIEKAKEALTAKRKFARQLKVDKAYHCHYMLPCSELYIKSFQEYGIKAIIPNNADCCWIPSVYGDEVSHITDSLCDTYWSNNMVRPVLFSQAVSYAFSEKGAFEVALHATGPTRATSSEQLTSAHAEMKAIWAQVIPGELSESHNIGPKTDFFHIDNISLLSVSL